MNPQCCFIGRGWGAEQEQLKEGGIAGHRVISQCGNTDAWAEDDGKGQGMGWGAVGCEKGLPGAARQPARRPYLPIIVECCCTAASSSLSKMVHSPIAVHPEAADKEWAAPGTFLLLAPPRATSPRWERIAPQLKKQTIFLKKIHEPPLPFIVLKIEK